MRYRPDQIPVWNFKCKFQEFFYLQTSGQKGLDKNPARLQYGTGS